MKHGVKMLPGVSYKSITDDGLLIEINGKEELLAVDNVIICAGQEPNRELQLALETAGMSVHLIGGANVAAELDAKRAIRQAAELAMVI
jgi:2,4-dienoyl-CoA reductase (NADPH2)